MFVDEFCLYRVVLSSLALVSYTQSIYEGYSLNSNTTLTPLKLTPPPLRLNWPFVKMMVVIHTIEMIRNNKKFNVAISEGTTFSGLTVRTMRIWRLNESPRNEISNIRSYTEYRYLIKRNILKWLSSFYWNSLVFIKIAYQWLKLLKLSTGSFKSIKQSGRHI